MNKENLLSDKDLIKYDNEGYILIKNAINKELVSSAINAYKIMRKKCETNDKINKKGQII